MVINANKLLIAVIIFVIVLLGMNFNFFKKIFTNDTQVSNKEDFFAFVNQISEMDSFSLKFLEQKYNLKFVESTSQSYMLKNSEEFMVYESSLNVQNNKLPISKILLYVKKTNDSTESSKSTTVSQIHLELKQDYSNEPSWIIMSDIENKFGKDYTNFAPSIGGMFERLVYNTYTKDNQNIALHFAYFIPSGKLVNTSRLPLTTVVVENIIKK